MIRFILLLGILLASSVGVANSQVIKVVKGKYVLGTAPKQGAWKEGTKVCVYSRSTKKPLGCGLVRKFFATRPLMQFRSATTAQIKKGDLVRLMPAKAQTKETPPQKSGSATRNSSRSSRGSGEKTMALEIGSLIGLSHIFPGIAFGYALSDQFVLHLYPFYMVTSTLLTKVTSMGALIEANYYFNERFKGLHLDVAAGLLKISTSRESTSDTESFSSIGGLAAVGYTLPFGGSAFLKFALGGEFFVDQTSTLVTFGFLGFRPILNARLGFAF